MRHYVFASDADGLAAVGEESGVEAAVLLPTLLQRCVSLHMVGLAWRQLCVGLVMRVIGLVGIGRLLLRLRVTRIDLVVLVNGGCGLWLSRHR